MSTSATIEPVRAAVTVAAAPERAWEVFTGDFARWWPTASHSIAAGEEQVPDQLVFEPREGGEIYEVFGGLKRPWARIHTWQPPRTLGFTWVVNPENPPTEMVVTFTPVEAGTRVDLVHSGWEAYGANRDALRSGYGGEGGWPRVLAGFVAIV